MKRIPLPQDKFALVDDEDFEDLAQYRWGISNGYAARRLKRLNKKQRDQKMHRRLLQEPVGKQVDHINGNKLDNRKKNLRICTPQENRRNRPAPKHNTSGYKGVIRARTAGKWQAQIKIESGKMKKLGLFSNKRDAAIAYNNAAIKYFGAFAWLNNIRGN